MTQDELQEEIKPLIEQLYDCGKLNHQEDHMVPIKYRFMDVINQHVKEIIGEDDIEASFDKEQVFKSMDRNKLRDEQRKRAGIK